MYKNWKHDCYLIRKLQFRWKREQRSGWEETFLCNLKPLKYNLFILPVKVFYKQVVIVLSSLTSHSHRVLSGAGKNAEKLYK